MERHRVYPFRRRFGGSPVGPAIMIYQLARPGPTERRWIAVEKARALGKLPARVSPRGDLSHPRDV